MMVEIKQTRQIAGEYFRRWFTDPLFDLIVWFHPDGAIYGFQLCYKKGTKEKALTWRSDQGYSHTQVDDGENQPGHYKMTPILMADGLFDKENVIALFRQSAQQIDPQIVQLVLAKMQAYPQPAGE